MRFSLTALFTLAFVVFAAPASAQRSVAFDDQVPDGAAIVIGLEKKTDIDRYVDQIGAGLVSTVKVAMEQSKFEPQEGGIYSVFVDEGGGGREIHLLGLAKPIEAARDEEDFGGRAAQALARSKVTSVALLAVGNTASAAANAAFGFRLGQYGFFDYKSGYEPLVGQVTVVTPSADAAQAAYAAHKELLADSVVLARNLQSEPANTLYPEEFVRRVRQGFRGVRGVTVTVLDERQMARLGMNAHLGVGQGSRRPPRLMIVEYNGAGNNDAPIAFVGKGITFDTGGISLKPNPNMWMMKADMTGAATVMGAALSLAKSRAPINLVAVAALAENMPDGAAQRPGDVVRSMSGKTIEIMSTDAEGRLVLADAVWYVQGRYRPKLLVDVATLTGSVGRALGDEYAGLFSRDDDIAEKVIAAGETSGEDVWRLPLHPNHDIQIQSVIADVKNGDTGAPGASTGAAFIGAFILPDTPWAHLDIAGVDWRNEPTPTQPLGASGFSVRLLDQLGRTMAAE